MLCLVAAMTPSPASAQLAPGHSGSPGVEYLAQEQAYYSLRQLGLCIAQNKADDARRLLSSSLGSRGEDSAVQALIGRETSCLLNASRLSVSRDLLRGAIAEALYKRDYGAAEAPPAGPALAVRTPSRSNRDMRRRIVLAEFAACYAAANPAVVRRLIMTTRLGSREEHDEVVLRARGFSSCLGGNPPGPIAPSAVRLAWAEALYARARTSAPAGPAR